MQNLIKKTILAGLGVLSLSHEKAEKIVKDLIKRGEVAETEEAKFVKDLMKQAEKNRVEIETKIKKMVEKTLTKLDIPTRKELNELKEKVNKLTKQLK